MKKLIGSLSCPVSVAKSCLTFGLILSLFSLMALGQVINVTPTELTFTSTNFAPSLEVFNGTLYLAYTSNWSPYHVQVLISNNGTFWYGPYDAGPTTGTGPNTAGPTLCVQEDLGTPRLHVGLPWGFNFMSAWSTNGTIWNMGNVMYRHNFYVIPGGYFPMNPDPSQEIGFDFPASYGTTVGEVLYRVSENNGIYDRNVWMLGVDSINGTATGNWGGQGTVPVGGYRQTDFNPAFKSTPERFLKAWTDRSSRDILTILKDSDHGINPTAIYGLGVNTPDGPSVAFDPADGYANHIVIGFKGNDSGQTINLYLNNYSSASVRQLNQWSDSTPAVACFNNKIIVAWKGANHQISVASVDFWN